VYSLSWGVSKQREERNWISQEWGVLFPIAGNRDNRGVEKNVQDTPLARGSTIATQSRTTALNWKSIDRQRVLKARRLLRYRAPNRIRSAIRPRARMIHHSNGAVRPFQPPGKGARFHETETTEVGRETLRWCVGSPMNARRSMAPAD
jgi:hypothetical protein